MPNANLVMKDIKNSADIKHLVDSFYKLVVTDPVIGHVFTEVVKLDWQVHIPVMYRFWETILIGTVEYKGSPIQKHIELDQKQALQPLHFERWIQLWETTVRSNFSGPKAEESIKRSKVMGEMIMYKINQCKTDGFIQ